MRTKHFLPIATILSVFFIFKLTSLGIRLSDSNIYFYTGYQLLQGQILYRDIFFTNFPLIPYITSIYFLLTAGNLKLFFLTPVIEVAAVAFIIYKITYKNHTSKFLALISSFIYLFSFIILSTSDHQSGVFIASFFSILSFYFYQNKKYLLTGIFIALALLTKVYFIPILLSYIAVFIWDREFKNLQKLIIGGVITTLVIMLPTIFLAFPEFIKQVFEYSLTRSQGIEKSRIFWFFITHDFILFVLLIYSAIAINKNKLLGAISIFGIIFLIFYQDIYYLYINFLIPFLVLSFPSFYNFLNKNFSLQKAIVPTIILPFLMYSFFSYAGGFRDLQRLNYPEIVNAIKEENPKVIYGVNDITPVLSYSTGVPLMNNIIDTNANIYRKGLLDRKKLTIEAITQKALLIAHGVDYPELGIHEEVGEIFDRTQIEKSCKLIKSFPVKMEGAANRINLLRCY